MRHALNAPDPGAGEYGERRIMTWVPSLYTGAPAVLVSPHVGTWRAADEQTIASLQISEHASQTAWVTFVSEDGRKMWRELTSIFAEESQVFKRLISYDLDPNTEESDPIEIIPGLRRDSVYKLRYHLQGITPWDLDALLTGLKPKLGQEALFEQLCPMLVLATDWQFNNVRDFAIKALTEYDDLPVPRIMLARRAKVADWLIGSYLELVLRLAPPTEHEAELLGIPSILTISKVREKVMIRRLSPISNNRPAVLLGKLGWWHFRCRYALTSAWRRALTKEHDKAATPECAMMTALEEIKLRTGRGLCRTCSPEKVVIEWLNLEEDRRIAKSMLKETLGVTMEMIQFTVTSTYATPSDDLRLSDASKDVFGGRQHKPQASLKKYARKGNPVP
ncbi:hypothetical protein FRB99_000981 [Tulasnella sp. 403]|nr:hypothetical protein FRB99_000981 [Tulasnella sp. 403]